MEFKFEYEPVRFIEMLSGIRANFPFLEESARDDAADDILNRMVVNRGGIPENGGRFWQRLDDGKIAKFNDWQDLKRIALHFGRESKRYKLWAGYFDQIRRIEADEAAGLLIMEFDNFVILDGKEENGWSYLYMKDYFEGEYLRYKGAKQQGTAKWRIVPEHVADARDLVIEGIRSDIYKVGYDRVHILYLMEILSEAKRGRFFFDTHYEKQRWVGSKQALQNLNLSMEDKKRI